MADTLTVKDVAEKLEVEPKALRKFLRSEVVEAGGKIGEDTPGKGRRDSFEPEEAEAIIERYNAWMAQDSERESEDEEDLAELEDLMISEDEDLLAED